MKVEFESIPDGISENQINHIKEKVQKLEKFYDQVVHTVIYLREEASATKVFEIKLVVKDATLFVKEEANSFEEATEKAIDVMSRQLKKYKERHEGK